MTDNSSKSTIGKVLVVDDNAVMRRILSKLLQKKEIEHELAASGREAVDMWRARRGEGEGEFKIILMDEKMPEMSGVEATKEIRRIEAESSTDKPGDPVVIIALVVAGNTQIGLEVAPGFDDVLTKPVTLSLLSDKLVEWSFIR